MEKHIPISKDIGLKSDIAKKIFIDLALYDPKEATKFFYNLNEQSAVGVASTLRQNFMNKEHEWTFTLEHAYIFDAFGDEALRYKDLRAELYCNILKEFHDNPDKHMHMVRPISDVVAYLKLELDDDAVYITEDYNNSLEDKCNNFENNSGFTVDEFKKNAQYIIDSNTMDKDFASNLLNYFSDFIPENQLKEQSRNPNIPEQFYVIEDFWKKIQKEVDWLFPSLEDLLPSKDDPRTPVQRKKDATEKTEIIYQGAPLGKWMLTEEDIKKGREYFQEQNMDPIATIKEYALVGTNIYLELETLPRDIERVSNISNFIGKVSASISKDLCDYLGNQLNKDFTDAFLGQTDIDNAYENNAWWNNFFVQASKLPFLKDNFLDSDNISKMMNFNQLCANYKDGITYNIEQDKLSVYNTNSEIKNLIANPQITYEKPKTIAYKTSHI